MIEELLGEAPVATLFEEESAGQVTGYLLADGRRVVVKLHRPSVSLEYLEAVHDIRLFLADAGYPAPAPLARPVQLGDRVATVEELLDRGERRDAHDPAVRRVLAVGLARLIELLRPFADVEALDGGSLEERDGLWPEPHHRRFDFEATRDGTAWIDEYAARARALFEPAGEVVVGHNDWSVKQFRFVGDEISAVYDWDSLCRTDEARLVGQAAVTFPATWYLPVAILATPDEARAFVSEYEAVRGRAFDGEERRRLRGAAAYVLAYGARCESTLEPSATSFPSGSQRETLARHGEEFLRL
jgi:hypothetical protein